MCKILNNVTIRVYNIHHAQAEKEKTPIYMDEAGKYQETFSLNQLTIYIAGKE